MHTLERDGRAIVFPKPPSSEVRPQSPIVVLLRW